MKVLGILGGMGSEATASMFAKVIRKTQADNDQQHLEIVIHNNNRIPDRTAAILYNEPSPLPELFRSVNLLLKCHVELIVMPCMTSHYFLPELQQQTKVPILNAIRETIFRIVKEYKYVNEVGLLATSGTVESGLFQVEATQHGLNCLVPGPNQQHLVMEAIYGKHGIKAGCTGGVAKAKLKEVARELVEQGAQAIIAGCTEVPLALAEQDVAVPFIDPVEVLAVKAIEYCGGQVRRDETQTWI